MVGLSAKREEKRKARKVRTAARTLESGGRREEVKKKGGKSASREGETRQGTAGVGDPDRR